MALLQGRFIAPGTINEDRLNISNAPSSGLVLGWNASNQLEWVAKTVDAKDVKVSAADTSPGYLDGKLLAGTGVTKTLGNSGGNETLTFAADIDNNSTDAGKLWDAAKLTTEFGAKANDNAVVHLTGNESIDGVKTFTSIPLLPASDPTDNNHAVRKAYVDNLLNGLSWRKPVLSIIDESSLPGAPSTGDRYLLQTGTHVNAIAEWSGSAWVYNTPANNWAVFVMDGDGGYTYDNDSIEDFKWIKFTEAGQLSAGDAITISSNSINVNYKDGIKLDSNSLMIALSTNKGLILEGTTPNQTLAVSLATGMAFSTGAIGIDYTANHNFTGTLSRSGFEVSDEFNVYEKHTLLATEISNRTFSLTHNPKQNANVSLVPVGGIEQSNGTDFSVDTVSETTSISWSAGSDLANTLVEGDVLLIKYERKIAIA